MTTLDQRISELALSIAKVETQAKELPLISMGFTDEKRDLTLRHDRLLYIRDNVCKALECPAFPGNPIPFAIALADLVRECGTSSIQSDDAKRILWILMSQSYGQLSTIDLSDEWDLLVGDSS
jgi:hypothetical protein